MKTKDKRILERIDRKLNIAEAIKQLKEIKENDSFILITSGAKNTSTIISIGKHGGNLLAFMERAKLKMIGIKIE